MGRRFSILLLAGCAPHLKSIEDTSATSEWVAPENEWTLNTPPASTVPEGFEEGDIPEDFRLIDQNGQEVSLWQFYGRWVVLDFSTLWCAPCQELAELAGETHEMYAEQGLEYLTLISQNLNYEPPSLEEIRMWRDTFELELPILADPLRSEGQEETLPTAWTANFVKGNAGFPHLAIIGPDLRIVEKEVRPNNDAGLRAVLDGLF